MSDEEELQDLMEVEFIGVGETSLDDDDQEKNENIQESRTKSNIFLVDVRVGGWDEDAISKCFQQAIVNYDCPSSRNENMAEYRHSEFEPQPNQIINQDGNIVAICGETSLKEDKERLEEESSRDEGGSFISSRASIKICVSEKADTAMQQQQEEDLSFISTKSIPLPKWALTKSLTH